jgi:hypothetical protein
MIYIIKERIIKLCIWEVHQWLRMSSHWRKQWSSFSQSRSSAPPFVTVPRQARTIIQLGCCAVKPTNHCLSETGYSFVAGVSEDAVWVNLHQSHLWSFDYQRANEGPISNIEILDAALRQERKNGRRWVTDGLSKRTNWAIWHISSNAILILWYISKSGVVLAGQRSRRPCGPGQTGIANTSPWRNTELALRRVSLIFVSCRLAKPIFPSNLDQGCEFTTFLSLSKIHFIHLPGILENKHVWSSSNDWKDLSGSHKRHYLRSLHLFSLDPWFFCI